MKSKGIIAIIVVLILVAAGVGAGVYLANNGNNGTHVDGVKSEVKAGDFISLAQSYGNTVKTKDVSYGEFLDLVYVPYGLVPEEGAPYPCEYDGRTYDCDKYINGQDTLYAVMHDDAGKEGGFILKIETKHQSGVETKKLVSTSMSVKSSFEEQVKILGKNTTFRYDTVDAGVTLNEITTITEFDPETKMMTIDRSDSIMSDMIFKVKEINADGKVVLENDKGIWSKEKFRQYISLDDWKKYTKDEMKMTYESTGKTTEKVSTAFGDRDVIVETFSVKDPVSGKTAYTCKIMHSEKGFIYSYNMSGTISEGTIFEINNVKDTSMRT